MPKIEANTALRVSSLPASPPAPRYSLSPEGNYILDCSVELGEITPLEAMVFQSNTSAARAFDRIGEQNQGFPNHWLRNTAQEYLTSVPLETRYVWAIYGLAGTQTALSFLIEQMEFVVQSKVQKDLGIDKLDSRFISDCLGHNLCLDKVTFSSVHDITRERVSALLRATYQEAIDRIAQDVQTGLQALQWVQSPENRTVAKRIAQELGLSIRSNEPDPLDSVAVAAKERSRQRQQHALVKKARKAIKKATRLLTGMGHARTLKLLISGERATISHPDSPFYFEVKPGAQGWLINKTTHPGGHVPYSLSVYTKRGVFLTRLCVLFKSTPVLDQLLALCLYVQSGQEEDILSNANWFGYEDATRVRRFLGRWAPQYLTKVPAALKTSRKQNDQFGLQVFENHRQHWAPFKLPVKTWIQEWCAPLLLQCETIGSQSITLQNALDGH